jgi:hypothetical protein
MKKSLLLTMILFCPCLSKSQNNANWAKPLAAFDAMCIAKYVNQCLNDGANFPNSISALPSYGILYGGTWLFTYTCPPGYSASPGMLGGVNCSIERSDINGAKFRNEFCLAKVNSAPPAECERQIDHAALMSALKSDLRILLNQMCKANSSDASRCDKELPIK